VTQFAQERRSGLTAVEMHQHEQRAVHAAAALLAAPLACSPLGAQETHHTRSSCP
jgi:hypothetical protein